jgi:hypothetical protein
VRRGYPRKRNTTARRAVVFLVAVVMPAGVANAAPATWYATPSGSDMNTCGSPAAPCATINAAIAKASGGDTVKVAVGTYTASGDQVVLIDRSVTLEGGWNSSFTLRTSVSTIDGGAARRGVVVATGTTATVDAFVIQHGAPSSGQITAGGVLNSGVLTLRNSRVVDSVANEGAGIATGGPGGLSLVRTTVSGNHSGGTGGGIEIYTSSKVTISESTVAGNSATIRGGGIYFYEATADIRNSTVSGNTAGWEGGGVWLSGNDADLNVSSSTIAHNEAGATFEGGGIYVGGGVGSDVILRNTILAQNTASSAPDCRAGFVTPVTSDGFNLVGNTSGCAITSDPSDLTGVDPLLGSLEDNGGSTDTHALLPGSPANDHGDPLGCLDDVGTALTSDQRGVTRPLGDACDIGAFEAEPPPNDDFGDGVMLDSLTTPAAGSNAFATKEPGEPDHALNEGGSSIWYVWTPTFSGTAYVSTAGSDFDTLVGVYTGSAVSSLTTIAADDDATAAGLTSKACFPASAGTAYKIAVDGFDAFAGGSDTEGSVTLTWGQYTSSDPCEVLPPTISGTPTVDQTLTATTGSWAGTPSGFAYQWFACDPDGCFAIDGATASTYTPPAEAAGFQLFVGVIAKDPSDAALDAISYSQLTDAIAAAPPPPEPSPSSSQPTSPPPQPPADTMAPTLRLSGSSSQRILRQGGVVVVVACPAEACTAAAHGTVTVPGSAKVFKLKPITKQIPAGGKVTLELRISKRALRAIGRALRHHKNVNAQVTVSAKDAARNVTTKQRTIRLKR